MVGDQYSMTPSHHMDRLCQGQGKKCAPQQRMTPIASFNNNKESHQLLTTATCVIGNSECQYSGGSSLLLKGWIDCFLNPLPLFFLPFKLCKPASCSKLRRCLKTSPSPDLERYQQLGIATVLPGCTIATFRNPALGSASQRPAPCHPLRKSGSVPLAKAVCLETYGARS